MRFPWTKPEPEYYEEPKPKRPRETLKQAAEKIYIRQLKKSKDVDMAEKVLGLTRPEPKTVSDFLRELKEYRAAMKEAGIEGDKEKGMWQQLLEALPAIPALLAELRQMQSQGMTQVQVESPQEQISEQPRQRLTEPKKPKAKPKQEQPMAPLSDLVAVLQQTPEEAYQQLKSNPTWIELLRTETPDKLIETARSFTNQPQYGQAVQELVSYLESEEGKKWLLDLIELARTNVNGGDNT